MKLILLGTGGYRPNYRRQTLCMPLPDYGICSTPARVWTRSGPVCKDPIWTFPDHAHLDHIVGLTYLLEVCRTHPLRRITVHGEADKLAAVDPTCLPTPCFRNAAALGFRPEAGPVGLAYGGRLSRFPLMASGREHWLPARHGRAHSMAYVTDTPADPAAGYVDNIHGVGL